MQKNLITGQKRPMARPDVHYMASTARLIALGQAHRPRIRLNNPPAFKTYNNMYCCGIRMNGVMLGGGVMAAILVAAAYPAYADDTATTAQELIDIWTDIRNDHLVEFYFEKSYTTPEMATIGTVNSAIELYDATRAEPQVQVRDRGNFVKHPANPYGTTVVAFEVINSMNTDEEVYPFVIDAGTLKMLAEGAFPGTVGLSAVFLHDTDRSLEEILTDLQESDGTWITYTFINPRTGTDDVKHVWLSLYDGYIFGSGYYVSSDDTVLENLATLVNTYDTLGADYLADINTDFGVAFVLDAVTLEVVAHTDNSITGNAIGDALGLNWNDEQLTRILAEHGNLWASYPSAESETGDEYIRAHLEMHDGYIFGSGYKITPEARTQSLVSELVDLYDLYGEDAFPIITALKRGSEQVVINPDGGTIMALAGVPYVIGTSLGTSFFDQDVSTLQQQLSEQPGLWIDGAETNTEGTELRRSAWLVLHDGYFFVATHTYSPELAAVEKVNAAIDAYMTYGKETFDRITWQSVSPEIIYPFVVDAQTWELVAHAAIPERVGVCCAAPIAASNDLDIARQDLEQNPGIWLEYSFYNPVSEEYEHKRVWLATYDDYTFAAGYYYENLDPLHSAIQEIIDLYDAQGKDVAFDGIHRIIADRVYTVGVLDSETMEYVFFSEDSTLVGTAFTSNTALQRLATLQNDGDTIVASYVHYPDETTHVWLTGLFWLHDGHIFFAGKPYVAYTR